MNEIIIRPSDLKADITIEKFIESYVCEPIRDIVRSHSLSVRYTIQLLDDEVLVSGEITGNIELVCVKCLEVYKHLISIPIIQSYAVGSEDINIEPEVRELVVLNIPDRMVCSDSCGGLCPVCGKNQNHGQCSCVKKQPSIQWEALKNIAQKLGGKNAKSKK